MEPTIPFFLKDVVVEAVHRIADLPLDFQEVVGHSADLRSETLQFLRSHHVASVFGKFLCLPPPPVCGVFQVFADLIEIFRHRRHSFPSFCFASAPSPDAAMTRNMVAPLVLSMG